MNLLDLPSELLSQIIKCLANDISYSLPDNCDEEYDDQKKERRRRLTSFVSLASVSTAFRKAVISSEVWKSFSHVIWDWDIPSPLILGKEWNNLFSSIDESFTTFRIDILKYPLETSLTIWRHLVAVERTKLVIDINWTYGYETRNIFERWYIITRIFSQSIQILCVEINGPAEIAEQFGIHLFQRCTWPSLKVLVIFYKCRVGLDKLLISEPESISPFSKGPKYGFLHSLPSIEYITINAETDDWDYNKYFCVRRYGETADRGVIRDISCSPVYNETFYSTVGSTFCEDERKFKVFVIGGMLKVFPRSRQATPSDFRFVISEGSRVASRFASDIIMFEKNDEEIIAEKISFVEFIRRNNLSSFSVH